VAVKTPAAISLPPRMGCILGNKFYSCVNSLLARC
jgi:hypothetical protein